MTPPPAPWTRGAKRVWWALTHLRALGLVALGLVVLLIHVSVLVFWIRGAEAGHMGPPR